MSEIIKYKPYENRKPDLQYHGLLRRLKEHGITKKPIHAKLSENKETGHTYSKELTGEILSFDLSNGFPVLTERDLSRSFFGAIGELVAFLNGQSDLLGLKNFGCPEIFWKRWVTKEKCEIFGLKEGELGNGSYGAVLGHFQTPKGEFNQVTAVLNNIRKAPYARTHVLTTWNPPYSMGDIEDDNFKREVVVAPCHGNFVHFILFDDLKELQMTHTQRSADVPVGLQFNIIQWAALGMMMSYLLGYTFTKYTHFLSNPHYYDLQENAVDELIKRKPRAFPTVKLVPKGERKRIQDFRKEDFEIEDYNPHPWFTIPTPV